MASKKAAKGPSTGRSKKGSVKDLSPRAGKSKSVVGGSLSSTSTSTSRTTLQKPLI